MAAYTLGSMIAELQPRLWPMGEQENLVEAHRQMMIEALIDSQTWVECLQINNTSILPQCDTYFRNGLTVLDAPRGRIKRLYTLDQINQTTGLEDPTVPTDWNSGIVYRQVDYSDLRKLISRTLAGAFPFGDWSWNSLAGLVAFPTCWQGKYSIYPPPTDAGLTKAPPLPMGFHYAQGSTNATYRAPWGMWALVGAQIFIAPWIQSTETIVIEYDGLKRNWQDSDLVDQDPNLLKAVQWYVLWQHALKYDRDYDAANAAVASYIEARSVLMHECREETEVRDAVDAVNSGARGASLVVPTYPNNPQTATAQCPSGTTGNPVTYTVPAGTIVSTVSQGDADSQAKSLALQVAGQQLNCPPIAAVYYNVSKSAQASCGNGGTGTPVSITIPAGTVMSTMSQADADTQAQQQAQQQANAALNCVFYNQAQPATANCPAGSTGSSVTVTIPAGAYTSTLSLQDANAKAYTAAVNQANSQLSCTQGGNPTTLFWNTALTVPVSGNCPGGYRNHASKINMDGSSVFGAPYNQLGSVTVIVPATTFSDPSSQSAANTDATQAAQVVGVAYLANFCPAGGGGLPIGGV